jgi:hypothetical protein
MKHRNILPCIFISFSFCFGLISFASSQEMGNEQGNNIIVMDGELEGSIEVFVDPTNFDCECEDVISHLFFRNESENLYLTEDGLIRLEIYNENYIFSFRIETNCCAVRPGIYTMNPSRWDIGNDE